MKSESDFLVPVAFGGGNTSSEIEVSTALTAHGRRQDFEVETFLVARTLLAKENDSHAADLDTYVAHTLRAEGGDASEDGSGRGTPIVAVPFDTTQITSKSNYSAPSAGAPCHPLAASAHPPAIAFNSREDPEVTWDRAGSLGASSPQAQAIAIQAAALRENPASGPDGAGFGVGVSYTLEARTQVHAIQSGWAVRRLTPTECERLQGFPDGYTLVPWRKGMAPDGPRYKALGNSMAVNVMRWVGQRIAMVEAIGEVAA